MNVLARLAACTCTARVTNCSEVFQQELTGEPRDLDVAETALLCVKHVIGADVGQLLCLQPGLRLSSTHEQAAALPDTTRVTLPG